MPCRRFLSSRRDVCCHRPPRVVLPLNRSHTPCRGRLCHLPQSGRCGGWGLADFTSNHVRRLLVYPKTLLMSDFFSVEQSGRRLHRQR